MPKSSVAAPNKSAFPISLGLIVASIVLLGLVLMPPLPGLSLAGQRMLAILAFAVIVWITEAVTYEVSAILITVLIAFLIGAAPRVDNPEVVYGTAGALSMALAGFSDRALALVAAALFISAGMTSTGFDKRIALVTLSKIGASTQRIMLGTVLVTAVLSLVVPSATARGACMVPIMLGIVSAFGLDRRSNIAAGIMIVVALSISIWNIGIQTAAAQNLLTVGFMERILGQRVTWGEWLLAGLPWAVVMSLILLYIVRKMLPPETESIPGGAEAVRRALAELGPMTAAQKRLMLVSLMLLAFWSTEGKLHSFDTTSVTFVGLALLLMPRIGVMDWKTLEARTPWGTLIVFGVGISLGTALLTTQAGQWLGDQVVHHTGMDGLSPGLIFAVLSLFLIVIHLGFASATALTSAMLPILIAVLQTLPGDFNRLGLTMLLGFTVSFGFILPINAPQNMVCLATDTFTTRQFTKIGFVVTVVGYLLLLVFSQTYWKLLGWI